MMKKLLLSVLIPLVVITSVAVFGSSDTVAADDFTPTEVGTYLYGVPERVTQAELKKAYSRTNYTVFNLENSAFTDNGLVGTGYKIKYEDEVGSVVTLEVVVLGDTDGNGKVTTTDYISIKTHFKAIAELKGVKLKAADVDSDEQISTADYMRVKLHFSGAFNIYKNAVIPTPPPVEDSSTEDTSEPWTSGWN